MDLTQPIAIAGVVVGAYAAIIAHLNRADIEATAKATVAAANQERMRQLGEYIDRACEELRRRGTTINYLVSLPISVEEKEYIHRMAFLRMKQRDPRRTYQQDRDAKGLREPE